MGSGLEAARLDRSIPNRKVHQSLVMAGHMASVEYCSCSEAGAEPAVPVDLPSNQCEALLATPEDRQLFQRYVATEVLMTGIQVLLTDMPVLSPVAVVHSKHSAVVDVGRSDVKQVDESIHYEACSFDYGARPVFELDIPQDEEAEEVEWCCLDGTHRAAMEVVTGDNLAAAAD